MNEAVGVLYALSDVVSRLRALADQHGSLKPGETGWNIRLAYTLARVSLTYLERWMERSNQDTVSSTISNTINFPRDRAK